MSDEIIAHVCNADAVRQYGTAICSLCNGGPGNDFTAAELVKQADYLLRRKSTAERELAELREQLLIEQGYVKLLRAALKEVNHEPNR